MACPQNFSLPPDLSDLVAANALSVAKLEMLTTLPSPKMSHASFKAICHDGQTVKLRQVETADQAARVVAIRAQLPDAHFPRLLAISKSAMIEEWIPGRSAVEDRYDIGLLQEAGSLLASIHCAAPPKYSFAKLRTISDRMRRMERQTGDLLDRGRLTEEDVAAIMELAQFHRPETLDAGIVHRDFAAENLVIGDDECIWIVDNETMTYDAFSYDLARTWYRWPLVGQAITHFLTGYQRIRSAENFERHFVFWTLSAIVDACLFRAKAETQNQNVPMLMLRDLINNHDAGSPVS
jgi:aminoglycoside phosphotransferase (APT) family kinase protein